MEWLVAGIGLLICAVIVFVLYCFCKIAGLNSDAETQALREANKCIKETSLFISVVIFSCMVCGCASVNYNTQTSEIKYSRLGNQNIEFSVIKENDGSVMIEFGQKSNRDKEIYALADKIAGSVAEGVVKGAMSGGAL